MATEHNFFIGKDGQLYTQDNHDCGESGTYVLAYLNTDDMELKNVLAESMNMRESLRELYDEMANGDPAWVETDPRAWKAKAILEKVEANN